jgi:phosphatidylinositol alpha-1,6-mannosyltransferase
MEDILIVTRNFPPLVGGMERLLDHAVRQLSQRYSCTLIGPAGCEAFAPPHTSAFGCRITPLPFFLLQSSFRTLAIAGRNKYRFILAGNGLTGPLAVLAKLLYGIPAISFVHGLDLVAANPVYQRLFVPWLRHMDLIIANSRNTAALAISKGVAAERIRILNPGADIPPRLPLKDQGFLAQHNLLGKRILLSVGRLMPRKGIVEFLRHAFPQIVASCPETILLIIGTEPGNSLKNAMRTRESIESTAEEQGLAKNLMMLGEVDDKTLSAAYGAADLFIFPVLDLPGDVEGFGMVAVEAAAHGLAVVAFASGGVTDAVQDRYSGFLIKPGDYRGFADTTLDYLLNYNSQVTRENCREFASRFEWKRFGERLLEICATVGNG